MDPNIVATNLATLVGLLCNFQQERGAREQLDRAKFLDWLGAHRHNEIRDQIAQNFHLSTEVDKLLQKDHEKILSELGTVSEILGTIMSRLDSFSGLANAVFPNVELSEQARDILVMFYDSGAQLLILMPHTSVGPILCLSPGNGVEIAEPRYVEDDLNTLVGFGFLAPDITSSGEPMYKLTRNGAKFVSLVKQAGKD